MQICIHEARPLPARVVRGLHERGRALRARCATTVRRGAERTRLWPTGLAREPAWLLRVGMRKLANDDDYY